MISHDPERMVARFDGPGRAIEFAAPALEDARPAGSGLRAGLHVGECELTPAGVRGLAVEVATEIAAMAASGEVVVTGTVRDLLRGSATEFAPRRKHGDWPLYAVAGVAQLAPLPAADTELRTLDRAVRTLARRTPTVARAALRVVKGE